MRGRFVLLTTGKELRETLRDRRTLAVMVLFPLVIYPLLALVGGQIVSQRERGREATPSRVAVSGPPELVGEVAAALDAKPKLFKRTSLGSRADVQAARLDALVMLSAHPGPRDQPQAEAQIAADTTRDESRRAADRLSDAIEGIWPAGAAPRFSVERQDLAPAQQLGGYVLSKVLPLMILLMVLLGAFYPAIDVTAGERERGTLETVLASPIPRIDLLLGKVLAVTVLASISGLLNLGSMTVTMTRLLSMAAPGAGLAVPWSRAAATGLVVVPTAFLLASLFVAVGSLARGFKEAQNFLVPVYFAFFAPAMLGSLGELPLSPALALVPGLNVSLLAREIAVGHASLGITALVLGATLAWGALALAAAARLYVSERFLNASEGDSGRRRRAGRTLRDEPATAGEALSLFGIGYLLLYFVFIPMQSHALVQGLLVSQWIGLFGLALLFARFTRRTVGGALGLRAPTARALVGAALMGAGGWMVANLIAQWVAPPPKEYVEAFRHMLFPAGVPRGFLPSFFLFALTPACCEEIFFRGLILRGLQTRTSVLTALVLSAAMFGLFHVDLYRLLPTTLLGLMLGFIAWRAGSTWASMLAHALNNGILIALGAAGLDERLEHLSGTVEVAALLAAALLVVLGAVVLLQGPPRSRAPAAH